MMEEIFHPHPNPLPSRARDETYVSLNINAFNMLVRSMEVHNEFLGR
jgi:hypothetical protein